MATPREQLANLLRQARVARRNLNWRKASYSSNGGGNCVGVADHRNRVLVRDTQTRSGPVLWFSPDAWRGASGPGKGGRVGPGASTAPVPAGMRYLVRSGRH